MAIMTLNILTTVSGRGADQSGCRPAAAEDLAAPALVGEA